MGFSGSMMFDKNKEKWTLNLNGMYGDITHAIQKLMSIFKVYLSSLSKNNRILFMSMVSSIRRQTGYS